MGMRDRSKRMFSAEFEKMVAEMPFEKIRIVDLAKRCEATPQTFYYHFKDKYELVAWMFLRDFLDVMQMPANKETAASIREMHRRLQERKLFYRKVFRDKSQNNIEQFIFQFNVNYSIAAFQAFYHTDEIEPAQMLAIRYHSHGIVGILRDWIFDEVESDIQTISDFDYSRIPDFLRPALENYTEIEKLAGM